MQIIQVLGIKRNSCIPESESSELVSSELDSDEEDDSVR